MRKAPWNDRENAAACSLYFRMLDGTLRTDGRLNKAALIRISRGDPEATASSATDVDGFRCQLTERTRPSIEMKLMNCSAIHKELGAEVTMDDHGYRAMPNYQTALKLAMIEEMKDRQLTADIATSQTNEQRAGA